MTIIEALADATVYPVSLTIDYRDRAGEPGSAHYSGIDADTPAAARVRREVMDLGDGYGRAP